MTRRRAEGDSRQAPGAPPDEFWDALVVGAGPAGSSAARRLALAGRRVLVLERSRMPRPKPCGGAVSARGLSFLDFPVPEELVNARVHGARIEYDGWSAEARLPDPVGFLVTRSKFDHFLLNEALEAGAEATFEEVTAIERDGGSVAARTSGARHRAKLAIIASGAASRLITCVRPRDADHEIGFCLEQDCPVMDPDPYAGAGEIARTYYGTGGLAYGWVFHHGTFYSVGVGGLHSRLRRPMDVMRRFWTERGFPAADLSPRGGFIPCGGIRRRLVADRLLLAGDAAGFVDPFTGEGISYAVRSGQLAAEAADAALGSGDLSGPALSRYARRCRREFGRGFECALAVARLIHRKPRLLLRILQGDPRILERYLNVTQGKLSHGGFLAWLAARLPAVAAREIILAGRSRPRRDRSTGSWPGR